MSNPGTNRVVNFDPSPPPGRMPFHRPVNFMSGAEADALKAKRAEQSRLAEEQARRCSLDAEIAAHATKHALDGHSDEERAALAAKLQAEVVEETGFFCPVCDWGKGKGRPAQAIRMHAARKHKGETVEPVKEA